MHKVLYIPEILDEIFSYTSKHTNTVAARVCQIWFTRSIPFIWIRVELNDALSVLSTFYSNDDGFKQPLFPRSWQRFFLYSDHVCYLECSDIKYTAFTQAALWRPSGTDLFSSKLVVLKWQGQEDRFDCLAPLLLPTLRILFISLTEIYDPDMMDNLCKTIALRSPLLRALEIDAPWSEYDDEIQIPRSLCELMSLLLDLISIFIPIHLMTPETFVILSRLPRLEDVLLSYGLNMDYVENHLDKKFITADEASQNVSPFPSLYFFVINDSLDYRGFTITKAFGQSIQLSTLHTLTCSPYCESSDEIVALMESVHIICPNLQSISILGRDCPSARLPWQAIEALLQCPELDTLKVSQCTIDMELDDVINLATDRDFWISIALPPTEPFSYQALVAFAENCPYLNELGLKLNSSSEFPVLGSDVWFSWLITLDVGDSVVTSCIDIGIFLSSICGKSLRIEATGEHASSWADVEKMVNSIVGTAQVRMLTKEITSLRKSQAPERTLHSISTQTVEMEAGTSKLPVIERETTN